MRVEVPEFKRCCFCLPLRYGLLVWSYLLLVPLAFLLVLIILFLEFLVNHSVHWDDIFWLTIAVIILLCNIGFNFLLIVAAHKKSLRLLKIYYVCGLISGAINFVFSVTSFLYDVIAMFDDILYFWDTIIASVTLQLIFVVMQLYIIVMVRSEILKLENNHSFEFFNNAAEGEMISYNPDSIQNVDQTDLMENTKESREKKTEAEEIRIYVPIPS